MNVYISALAAGTVATLAPALPYLTMTDGGAAAEAGNRTFGSDWEQCTALWSIIQARAEHSPALAESLADLARQPSDEDSRAVLRVQLRKMLDAEPSFAEQLAPLLEGTRRSVTQSVVGNQNVVAGGDLRGSIITFNERPST